MGFLSRKPKIGIEEFCQQFYDSQIFHAIIAGEDVWSGFLETVFKSIAEVDQSFAIVDLAVFKREMTALRLELFGLAWVYKFPCERFTIPQIIFTRQYLERNGKLEIWDTMGEYNKDCAQSAFLTKTGEQMEGRAGRGRITFVNTFRWGIFEKWAEANIGDPSAPTEEEKMLVSCVAHVVSRMLVDKRNLFKLLTARLADRLSCDPNLSAEALLRLGAVIFVLYEGAMEAIKSVNLQVREPPTL
ncbi:MAG: hypothetical protein ISS53_01450 [Dehalococcoidia bacterium]|nr:hypothetical protein [Dehalococcoidia bacterium]